MKSYSKYAPKKPYTIVYLLLIWVGTLLAIGRWFSVVDSHFVVISAEIHSHISNLSLSMIFYLGIGFSWLMSGMKFRNIALLGVLLLAGNFICETLMGFMNTPDIMDAVYGVVGVAVAFVFLFLTAKFGLIPKQPKDENETTHKV